MLEMDPDEPNIVPLSIESSALVEFLVRPIVHDLYCRGNTCRFSVDERGAIDPLPFNTGY
jgi:hypothetical protein